MLVAFWLALSLVTGAPACARNLIEVLPTEFAGPKTELMQRSAQTVENLKPGDRLLVFQAQPFRQVAALAIPDSPNSVNPAWVKRQLAAQFAPLREYIANLPTGAAGSAGNLMIPAVLDEIGRNIIPSLPEKKADVLMLGSLLYFDSRDGRWAMRDRRYPSDGLLRLRSTDTPFGIAGKETRLAGATIHYCSPDGPKEYATAEYGQKVRRFWTIWTVGQSGKVGTFSDGDLATCFDRFSNSRTDGQPSERAIAGVKPEMLQASGPKAVATSAPDFLRDDAPISRTPPSTTIGVAWIGIKWKAHCDIDLWARPDADSDWLFFGQLRTDAGHYNHDYQNGTGDKQFEYIVFEKPIDLGKAEVVINLYEGDLPSPPEGIIRVLFDQRVYEAPFKLKTATGNHAGQPMTAPYWLSVDLRALVGAPAKSASK